MPAMSLASIRREETIREKFVPASFWQRCNVVSLNAVPMCISGETRKFGVLHDRRRD